jgi:hypothetical protein
LWTSTLPSVSSNIVSALTLDGAVKVCQVPAMGFSSIKT